MKDIFGHESYGDVVTNIKIIVNTEKLLYLKNYWCFLLFCGFVCGFLYKCSKGSVYICYISKKGIKMYLFNNVKQCGFVN